MQDLQASLQGECDVASEACTERNSNTSRMVSLRSMSFVSNGVLFRKLRMRWMTSLARRSSPDITEILEFQIKSGDSGPV